MSSLSASNRTADGLWHIVLAGMIAVEGLGIWVLWNALVPALAGRPSVTYVQGVLIGVALNIAGVILGRSTR